MTVQLKTKQPVEAYLRPPNMIVEERHESTMINLEIEHLDLPNEDQQNGEVSSSVSYE